MEYLYTQFEIKIESPLIIENYNKNRSKNTIIILKSGIYSLCLYKETQKIMQSAHLSDILNFAKDKSNEEMIKLYKELK